MVYYGAKELAASARVVRGNTIRIAEDIPEGKFGYQPAPECRTVAQMFAHIALACRFQYRLHGLERRKSLEGFDFGSMMEQLLKEEAEPRSKAQILALLRKEGDAWADWLDTLADAFLAEQVGMPPGATPASKSRFEMILSVKEHEMHHRGQLMLIERLLGIVPHLTVERQARMAGR